jgi:DNA-binding PadR family transcriptional regulator
MAKKSSAHTLEYILLGLIREEPSHGYALFEQLQQTKALSLIWQVKRSKLYYLLEKSEREGYLETFTTSQGPYPDRKVYRITDLGREVLEDWLHTPVKSSRFIRLAFLSKLHFLAQQDHQAAVRLIDKQLEICLTWRKNLEIQSQPIDPGDFISSQVFAFRIGQINAMIDWLEDCRNQVPGG